ncbi:VOC family protein [Streptacidiphilus melanogenes]|uniref:VOC family protein n=1 Tax=Streptacidiphilus melanogenes TaxID=411235 RepID=UPI0005A83C43|nr:VOC family protein [Streptacidiphilus melanogenes]
MPDVTSYPDGAPCWADLNAPDLESARRFYGAALGWEFQDKGPEYGHYTMCLWKGKPVAALMPPPPSAEGLTPAWNVYLRTSDVDATIAAVEAGGGKIAMGPHDVPAAGRLAFAFDPQGASFGLWQPEGHEGAALYGEPGAMCWNEIYTTAGGAADAFYAGLFDYKQIQIGDGTNFDYTTWTPPGAGREACGRLRATDPAHELAAGGGQPFWSVYFAVAKVDETAEQIAALGGSVLHGPFDSPYGRLCVVRDPSGAHFSVMTLARR